jgi:long-chain fatty acid transport protein
MKSIKFLSILIFFSLSFSLFATNGYFSHGFGTKNKSMAGVASAVPLNSFSASTNPAELVFVGDRYDMGLAIFIANRGYTMGDDTASEKVDSDTDFYGLPFFVIPHIGSSFMLKNNMALGFNLYGNGGMNTNYDKKVYAGGTSPTSIDISQLFFDTNFAYKFLGNQSVGISLVTAIQWVKVLGIDGFSFMSSDTDNLVDNGYSFSYGAGVRIGYYGTFLDNMISVGISYQSEVFMTKFKEYAGLFAEQGGFNIPATLNLGFAIKPITGFTIAFDYQRIFYSQIKSVSNKMDMSFAAGTLLGEDNGSGFGWEDMNVFKLGFQYESATKDWSVRAGYSYAKKPMGEEDVLFNILAPATLEHHITFGASMKIFGNKEISVAYMYGLNSSIKGPNPMAVNQTNPFVEIEMNQHEIEFEFSF